MRDGRELARLLREAPRDATALNGIVDPYLQFVRKGETCSETGLPLIDIWRYFRHTWAIPYKSVPGRTMMILVRDRACEFHPVIGIAALSSAAVGLTVRDEWIGWTAKKVIAEMRARPTAAWAKWLQRTVAEGIEELFRVDFIEDELLTPAKEKRPSAEVVSRLEADARELREEHYRFMRSRDYKKVDRDRTEDHWEEQARSPLFRSKRAKQLSGLLEVRMTLHRFLSPRPSRAELIRLVESADGRRAVARVVRSAKSKRVGTAIADISVCGAIPPYSEILGGKLVAALMASPEVVAEYRRRYGKAVSVIASSMAGREIVRPAELVFLGTTSLYGTRPCQYDRISPAIGPPGDRRKVAYQYLGRTLGVGTFQFGEKTVAELAVLLAQSRRGQQVNSIFGEGVNPRLRKIRDGLNELGVPTAELLNHGAPRLIYGVSLIENLRDYLLGIAARPKYLIPQKPNRYGVEEFVRWWLERWIIQRIARDDVLQRMQEHHLTRPICHGARVRLPREDFDQTLLFDGSG
ncbi:MAG: Druantia anti-phage system protein DruA [Planctomycetaceae bacterium]